MMDYAVADLHGDCILRAGRSQMAPEDGELPIV